MTPASPSDWPGRQPGDRACAGTRRSGQPLDQLELDRRLAATATRLLVRRAEPDLAALPRSEALRRAPDDGRGQVAGRPGWWSP